MHLNLWHYYGTVYIVEVVQKQDQFGLIMFRPFILR